MLENDPSDMNQLSLFGSNLRISVNVLNVHTTELIHPLLRNRPLPFDKAPKAKNATLNITKFPQIREK